MNLVKIYECFCDRTRLRILNLLLEGPLCVCHFQDILREPQVKISKHLAYLRRNGLVQAERSANWMIYSLPEKRGVLLGKNLSCLQDCLNEDRQFQEDRARLRKVRGALPAGTPGCVRARGKSQCGCGGLARGAGRK